MRLDRPVFALLVWPCVACYSPNQLGQPSSGGASGQDEATTSGQDGSSEVSVSSSGADSASSAGPTMDSSSGPASTTSAPAGCTDGEIDDGEICDDGDALDGNGCNQDCVPSGTPLWTIAFDGASSLDDRFLSVTVGNDGTIFAGGFEGAESAELGLVVAYDPEGVLKWSQNFTVGGEDSAVYGIAASADGPIYAATANSLGVGELSRFSADGAFVDAAPTDASLEGVEMLPNGDVALAGTIYPAGEAWLGSMAGLEGVNWAVNLGSGGAHGVATDGDGNILGVGSVDSALWVEKLDPEGQRIWHREFGSAFANSVDVAPDGSIAVVGLGDDATMWIGVLDAEGIIVWMDLYDEGEAEAFGVKFGPDGNLVVVGRTVVPAFAFDAVCRKYDPKGVPLWTARWDTFEENSPESSTSATAVDILPSGTIVVAGYTQQSGAAGSSDGWIRAYTP